MFKPFRLILAALMLAFLPSLPGLHAASMSDYLENKIADHVFRTTTYTAPSGIYIALFTSACSDRPASVEQPQE